MATEHYTAFVCAPSMGGDQNPALLNFWFADLRGGQDDNAADIAAFCSYLGCGDNAYLKGISVGLATGGGQLPIPFPVAKYAALAAADSNLKTMTAWGQACGDAIDLTVAGTGAVIRKQTDTAGRHGRGRMTTPWLAKTGVTAIGTLTDSLKLSIYSGYQQYITGVGTSKDDKNILWNSSGTGLIITSVSVTTTLGRVRSRRK